MVAISYGSPFDRSPWSGITYHLFTTLRRAGFLADVVDGRSQAIDRLSQVVTFAPSRRRWMQSYMVDATPLTHAAEQR